MSVLHQMYGTQEPSVCAGPMAKKQSQILKLQLDNIEQAVIVCILYSSLWPLQLLHGLGVAQ